MLNKIVFFTQRVEVIESYGERRDCADQRISEFISACGFVPVPIPNNVAIIRQALDIEKDLISGIVLTGGNSIVKYGGNAPERDETDRFLIKYALDNNVPLYGFCRGMQSILDYFGNELVNVEGHVATRHVISGVGKSIEVNSYHNQACIRLEDDSLNVEMSADDGVIEMIKHKSKPILGTMWHPEREKVFSEDDINREKRLFI